MRARLRLVLAVVLLPLLSGCSDLFPADDSSTDSSAASSSAPPTPSLHVLTSGKSVVELDAGSSYRSPQGFSPQVTVNVTGEGWVSTHRGPDAFDVSQPVQGEDAALVVYAFVVPPEGTAEEALAALRRRAEDAGAEQGATGDSYELDLTGGDGPLVTSRDGGIALDAVPTGYVRISSTEHTPFLTVWWVPDAAHRDEAEALASTLSVVTEP